MNLEHIDQIAKAVLYEGYLLYPYRPSAVKNQQRWTFGGVYPQAFSEHQRGTDPWIMQTECLVEGEAGVTLDVMMRFLRLIDRQVGKLLIPLKAWPENGEPEMESVKSLTLGDKTHCIWQEAEEESVSTTLTLGEEDTKIVPCHFKESRRVEPLQQDDAVLGALIRRQKAIDAEIHLSTTMMREGLYKVTIRIQNVTPIEDVENRDRDEILLQSMASCHTILASEKAAFLSSMDRKPEHESCENMGTWPVLVGEKDDRKMMLSSPIILYDYPEIAPESQGDFFDGTEIDEMLTLRILTMTDEEKQEMKNVDAHARALLERTESLTFDEMAQLHGRIRQEDTKPSSVMVQGRELKKGDRVKLLPKRKADVFDLALEGKTATIQSIEQDFENRTYVVVTVDDDPGADIGEAGKIGHRFFFGLEEIEPV